ncbi:MAG TPA: PAC2 family protein [Acidimicrobiia bacterium]
MLHVEQWPELVDPVLVYSFTGWVDAGLAGLGTLELLVEQIEESGGGRFGAIDLTDLLDLQQTRPTVALEHGDLRRIAWPEVELWSGQLGRDVICMRGPEPSIRWPAFAQWIVDVATHLRVREAFALGGMPAVSTHRRPVPVLASATRRSVAQEVGPLRDDYLGATGLNTIVQHALGEAGVRSVALWAQVPQYVSGSPSPPAVRSLASRLIDLGRLEIDLAGLDVRAAAYRDKVEEGLAERPDVLSIVDQIDEQLDQRIPSADELASEIEQYLRGRPEE